MGASAAADQLGTGACEILARRLVVRLQPHGLLEMFDRLVQPSGVCPRGAEIVVNLSRRPGASLSAASNSPIPSSGRPLLGKRHRQVIADSPLSVRSQ